MNKLLTQVHNWKYDKHCPMEVVFNEEDGSELTLQWESSVHRVLESCEDKYGKQIEYLFQQVVTSHQGGLFSLIEEYISKEGLLDKSKKLNTKQTLNEVNGIVKGYFYKDNSFWEDVESLIRENREDLLEK